MSLDLQSLAGALVYPPQELGRLRTIAATLTYGPHIRAGLRTIAGTLVYSPHSTPGPEPTDDLRTIYVSYY